MAQDADPVPGNDPTWARRMLLVGTSILLAYTVFHFGRAWHTGGNLGQSSGIVIGQAMDLADGVFYRPLVSERGFGGTRYMPLPFVVIAPFIRMGLDPINAAIAITLLTDLALLCGIFVLLRRLGVARSLAWAGTIVVLAAGCGQYAATTVRGDLLPATMNVWGLVLVAGQRSRSRLMLAAVFFSLAFTGKVVALYGVAGCLTAMAFTGHWRDAVKLGGYSAGGILLCLGLIDWASEGRFAENMRACAGGGTSWQYVWDYSWKRLWRVGFRLDWTAAVLVGLAVVAGMRVRREQYGRLPFWTWVMTGLVTVGLFVSPGVSYNVLLDWVIASVVFVMVEVSWGRMSYGWVATALSVVSVGAIPYLMARHGDKGIGRGEAAAMLGEIGRGGKPILCKAPMLSVHAGEAPQLLDPWMFRHSARHRELTDRLYGMLRRGDYRAVVLGDLGLERVREWTVKQYGRGLMEALREGYSEAARAKEGKRTMWVIWKPKSEVKEGEAAVVKLPVGRSWSRWWRSACRRLGFID